MCLVASKRAALSPTILAASSPNTVHEPVVKSCILVPTASTTSACAAMALAEVHPVTPMGPQLSGWWAGSEVRPAVVSTTGMPWASAKAASCSSARDQRTPPPAMIRGLSAEASAAAARCSSPASGRDRRMRCSVSSKKRTG